MSGLTLNQIAKALGGETRKGRVLAPGPGHSAGDRSLSVGISDEEHDGFVVHSFADDDAMACRDYVRERLGLLPFTPNGGRADGNPEFTKDTIRVSQSGDWRGPLH